MKTLRDLLLLVAEQEEKNQGKMVQYLFRIDTRYGWFTVLQEMKYFDEDGDEQIKDEVILDGRIDSPEELQICYYTVLTKCRK
jgi:hypothetical protein